MALGHLEHISIELFGFGRQMHEIWQKCLLERWGSKGIGGVPLGLDCFVNMLGMMYDGCLDGAHLDKLFLKHIFLNFFLSKAKV